jgi:hypothetical protein
VPALKVANSTNHQVSLSWTNTATGFILKQSTNLASPVLWSTVTNAVSTLNGQFVVTVTAGAGSRFFLLSFE